jgi:hypothetical protein
MSKHWSISALALVAVLAAAAFSSVSAASIGNFSAGHASTGRIDRIDPGSSGRNLATVSPVTASRLVTGPKQRRWVCGPIVNYDGTPHCHWVP